MILAKKRTMALWGSGVRIPSAPPFFRFENPLSRSISPQNGRISYISVLTEYRESIEWPPMMFTFHQIIAAPRDVVFAFFRNPRCLPLLHVTEKHIRVLRHGSDVQIGS